MLGRGFFENSRLVLIDEPVFVTDADKRILYENKAYKAVGSGKLVSDDAVTLDFGHKLTNSGRVKSKFLLLPVKLFGEKVNVCIDETLKCRNFPIINNGTIYTSIRTFTDELHIPFFGGRVRKIAHRASLNDFRISEMIGIVSEYDVKCLCIEPVVTDIVDKFKDSVSVYGYRIDVGRPLTQNPVCKMNLFDMAVVCDLIMAVMLKLSHDRTLTVLLDTSETICRMIFKVNCTDNSLRGNMRIRDVFGQDRVIKEMMESLEDFCGIYSWKLACRLTDSSIELGMFLPVYNFAAFRFKNEDQEGFEAMLDQVGDMLHDQISAYLK